MNQERRSGFTGLRGQHSLIRHRAGVRRSARNENSALRETGLSGSITEHVSLRATGPGAACVRIHAHIHDCGCDKHVML